MIPWNADFFISVVICPPSNRYDLHTLAPRNTVLRFTKAYVKGLGKIMPCSETAFASNEKKTTQSLMGQQFLCLNSK